MDKTVMDGVIMTKVVVFEVVRDKTVVAVVDWLVQSWRIKPAINSVASDLT